MQGERHLGTWFARSAVKRFEYVPGQWKREREEEKEPKDMGRLNPLG